MFRAFLANKYAQATGTAFATGLVTAIIAYLGIITDHMDSPHIVKIVGLAFMAPFSSLIALLPRLTDIITPSVRLISQERMTAIGVTTAPNTTLTTHAAETTVIVEPPEPPAP